MQQIDKDLRKYKDPDIKKAELKYQTLAKLGARLATKHEVLKAITLTYNELAIRLDIAEPTVKARKTITMPFSKVKKTIDTRAETQIIDREETKQVYLAEIEDDILMNIEDYAGFYKTGDTVEDVVQKYEAHFNGEETE